MKKFDYENKEYLSSLDRLGDQVYSKYLKFIKSYLRDRNKKILDVGCGNGSVLIQLKESGYKNLYGAEISNLFIAESRSKGLKNIYHYDGSILPFKDRTFDLIGSFNVLEHVQEPEIFLENQISKLKKNGIIIVACPNFLSVLYPSRHRRLKGLKRKFANLLIISSKLLSASGKFEKMDPVIQKKFEYDDDAIVVTNLLELKSVFKRNNCEVMYESGFINFDSPAYRFINSIPLLRYLLPSCFVVARKIK